MKPRLAVRRDDFGRVGVRVDLAAEIGRDERRRFFPERVLVGSLHSVLSDPIPKRSASDGRAHRVAKHDRERRLRARTHVAFVEANVEVRRARCLVARRERLLARRALGAALRGRAKLPAVSRIVALRNRHAHERHPRHVGLREQLRASIRAFVEPDFDVCILHGFVRHRARHVNPRGDGSARNDRGLRDVHRRVNRFCPRDREDARACVCAVMHREHEPERVRFAARHRHLEDRVAVRIAIDVRGGRKRRERLAEALGIPRGVDRHAAERRRARHLREAERLEVEPHAPAARRLARPVYERIEPARRRIRRRPRRVRRDGRGDQQRGEPNPNESHESSDTGCDGGFPV